MKGTWKDEPLPAAGQAYDLGAHLIDQTLQLFGRPEKITAFLQNVRGIGHAEVDDTVSSHFYRFQVELTGTIIYPSSQSYCTTQQALLSLTHLQRTYGHTFCPFVHPNLDT